MTKKYSKLLGILALCCASFSMAEENQSILLNYDSNPTSVDDVFDTEGTITITSLPAEDSLEPQMPTNLSAISADIINVLNVENIDWQGMNNHLQRPDEIRNLYAQLNYQPLWTDNGKVTRLAEQVIHAVSEASTHALRPELYHSDAFSTLTAGQTVSEPAKFEVILSDAFVTYKSHLSNGIVDPKAQFPFWNKSPTILDYANIYLNAKSSGNISNIFTVNDPDYQVLQTTYLNELANINQNNFIAVPATSLKPGEFGEAVKVLRQRLGLNTEVDVYDDELKQAVKNYQKDNGLGADGIAGKRTLRLLNRSPKNHLQTLAINMERHRWGYTPDSTYLQVNIPAFNMAIRNGKQRLFESNVIVGKTKRPTPIFSDTLENVVLAPYWNVPKTIFKEDKLPKLKRNPNAFGGNMQVISTSTGKVVDPASVDWSNGGKGYRLRQKPGARNALGRMKFLFPNRHAIYLHDTPNRRLFKRSRRALSSGCIRVERAEDLAVFLLKDMNYDRKRIKKESRGTEKWVELEGSKRYPVFLDYYTAWVDANDVVHYSSDLYGHDRKLKKLYQNALNGK